DDALAFGGREYDDALRRSPRDADAVDRAADELAAVGDQHDLVGLLDRERGHHAAGLAGHRHGDDAFAPAAGGAVFVGRGALAKTALGNGEHEFFRRRHFDVALLALLDPAIGGRLRCLLGVTGACAGARRLLLGLAAPHRARALEIGGALVAGRRDVAQD